MSAKREKLSTGKDASQIGKLKIAGQSPKVGKAADKGGALKAGPAEVAPEFRLAEAALEPKRWQDEAEQDLLRRKKLVQQVEGGDESPEAAAATAQVRFGDESADLHNPALSSTLRSIEFASDDPNASELAFGSERFMVAQAPTTATGTDAAGSATTSVSGNAPGAPGAKATGGAGLSGPALAGLALAGC